MMYLGHSPAGDMSQPGEKLNRVSTHYSSLKKALAKITNGLDDRIFFRSDCRVAIEDSQSCRCRSTTKMLIPSRRTDKHVSSQKDGLLRLHLVELFNRAFTKPLISCPAQPTPTRQAIPFISGDLGRKRCLRFTIPGKPNKETTRHDVARDNVTWPI
jgi:hypothetical protein